MVEGNGFAVLVRTGLRVAALGSIALAGIAFAQVENADEQAAQLAAEAEQSATEAGAMQLAAQLEMEGDLTAAASVLERYLIADRDAVAPRAEYAMLLCRLDDVQAGRFERSKLASIPAGADVLSRVDGVCGTESVAAWDGGQGSAGQ